MKSRKRSFHWRVGVSGKFWSRIELSSHVFRPYFSPLWVLDEIRDRLVMAATEDGDRLDIPDSFFAFNLARDFADRPAMPCTIRVQAEEVELATAMAFRAVNLRPPP